MPKNNAKIFDKGLYMMAGIDPATGKPTRGSTGSNLKYSINRLMRIIDEQDAINRYKWYNLPCNLTSQELERLLYYKGQLVFFYFNEKFYFMPYALDGTIDFYGRYNTVHPIPMTSGQEKEEETDAYKSLAGLLSNIKLNIAYDVMLDDEITADVIHNTGVILRDYSHQLGQNITPRYILNDALLSEEADIICYLDLNLLIGSGVIGYRVNDAESKTEVTALAESIYKAATNRNPYVATIGNIDFQSLDNGTMHNAQDYLLSLQSLENLRLSTYGIANGGLYEKKAHILESEQALNNSNTLNSFVDGLKWRQEFAAIANSIWGTYMWCEPNESEIMVDIDGDGVILNDSSEKEPIIKKEQETTKTEEVK